MNAINRRSPMPGQSGLTLLEILIAVLVLSVGLLGVAGLQLTGLKNGQQSYQRSQVAVLAYEMADRMHANRQAAETGAYAFAAPPPVPGANCQTGNCTSAELAAWDTWDWYTNNMLPSLTPGASATIVCTTVCGPGLLQTLTITWDETRVTPAQLSSYVISFVP